MRRERPSDQAGWTTLPAAREGEPPRWPLSQATREEARQWKREWIRPQAVMWELAGQVEEVAVYVRTLIAGESKSLSVLLRQQEALGLSQPGLARRRWKIENEPAAPSGVKQHDPDRTGARARLKLLQEALLDADSVR